MKHIPFWDPPPEGVCERKELIALSGNQVIVGYQLPVSLGKIGPLADWVKFFLRKTVSRLWARHHDRKIIKLFKIL